MVGPPTIEPFTENGREYERVTYGDVTIILQGKVLQTRFKAAIDLMMEHSPPPAGVYPFIFVGEVGDEHAAGRRVQRGSIVHTQFVEDFPEFAGYENIILLPARLEPPTEEWAGLLVHEIRHFGHQTPQGPPTDATTEFMIECEADAYRVEREFYRRLKIPSKRRKTLLDRSRKNEAAARPVYLEYIRPKEMGK